jgi:hypothetical protein
MPGAAEERGAQSAGGAEIVVVIVVFVFALLAAAPVPTVLNCSEKGRPPGSLPMMRPMIGMMTSFTSKSMMLPKSAPVMTPNVKP